MTATNPQIISTPVRYHEDASGLFALVGGTAATDTLLLESADITTRSGLNSIAVLSSSLRVTCSVNRVHVEALTDSGRVLATQLRTTLAQYVVGEDIYEFPASEKIDERERLTDISSVEVLRALTRDAGYRSDNDTLPMLAGGISYDYLETFEELPAVEPSANTYPDYQFFLAEIVLSIDHETGTAHLDAVDAVDADGGSGVAARVDELASQIETATLPAFEPAASTGEVLEVNADIPDDEYRAQVEKLKKNIYNGDIYQVVPARTFTAECPDAFAAYRELREINPSPYMFYTRGLDVHGEVYELFGASPESNLKFNPADRRIEMYPIAGTRPRGVDPLTGEIDEELDIRMELELRTDSKEIAEHTMLVDLARNDLARVAVAGTRRVADLLQVDRYSRVMHLVSRVTAELHPDLDALDAYRACMNMGTLTGAPKLKAMELLRGVEKRRRGSYGGAIGYLRGDGTMDTCIVIRSAYVSGGVGAVQAGAGVVRDSNPQAEADETLHKAWAALNAIALAQGKDMKVVR